jgi:hypothetical protein
VSSMVLRPRLRRLPSTCVVVRFLRQHVPPQGLTTPRAAFRCAGELGHIRSGIRATTLPSEWVVRDARSGATRRRAT